MMKLIGNLLPCCARSLCRLLPGALRNPANSRANGSNIRDRLSAPLARKKLDHFDQLTALRH